MTERAGASRSSGSGELGEGSGEFDLTGSGAASLKIEDPLRVGDVPLLGRLGSGGMGRVYLGLIGGEYAAVKQVHPHFAEDPAFLRRFGRELDDLARLPGDVAAPLLAGDREARPPWCATAYVPGLTLGQAVELHRGPLPAAAVWLLLRHLAAGLSGVHELDLAHRDLKPSNVVLTLDGVTLLDFGIAHAAGQSRLTGTGTGMAAGTLAYLSPEQAAASTNLGAATDVFALGSLVTYAATGRPPFGEGAGHEVLYRILHSEPELGELRSLDAGLADVAASCLDKDPQARPTARELADLAEERLAGRTTGALASATAAEAVPGVPAQGAEAPPAAEPEARAAEASASGGAAEDGATDGHADGPSEPEEPPAEGASAGRAVGSSADGPAEEERPAEGAPGGRAAGGPADEPAAEGERPAEEKRPAEGASAGRAVGSSADGPAEGERPAEGAPGVRVVGSPGKGQRLGWPAAVLEVLSERAAFVGRPRPTPEQLGAAAEPTSISVAAGPPLAGAPWREPRRWRKRTLLVGVPVVLAAATTVLLQLLPDSAPGQAADGGRHSTASAPQGPGTSRDPSSAAATATSGAGTGAATASPPSALSGGGNGVGGQAGSAAGAGGGTATAGGSAGAAGSSGGAGSASGGTSGTSGAAGGTATVPAQPPAPGGPRAYRNGATGTCLRASGTGAALTLGSCADDRALWTMTAVSGGYHLVNEATSQCLQAGLLGNHALQAGCTTSVLTGGLQTWYPVPGDGLADRSDGACLTVTTVNSTVTGVATRACDGSPAQVWRPR